MDQTSRLQLAKRLRAGATGALALGVVAFSSWRFNVHQRWWSDVNELNSSISRKLELAQETIDDCKEAAIRTIKWVVKGGKLEQKDPLVRQALQGRPWRLVRRSQLPLLADRQDLNLPVGVPTLVIDLDEVLAKVEYDRRFGWRIMKRPFADDLIKQLVFHYEVIVWTKQQFPIAHKLMSQWNLPTMGVLHREDCTQIGRHLVKDISRLGREESRVVMVDADSMASALQPRNALRVTPFDGTDGDDRELEALTAFLKGLAVQPGDLRRRLDDLGRTSEAFNRALVQIKKNEARSATLRVLASSLLGR